LSFWEIDLLNRKATALIDAATGEVTDYGTLADSSKRLAEKLAENTKRLVFLFCDNSAASVVNYVAALRSGQATLLVDKKLDNGLKADLISIYRPDFILAPDPPSPEIIQGFALSHGDDGHYVYRSVAKCGTSIYPDLAVLLSTSGTTGSPKLVKLSYKNVQANAKSIVEYLGIDKSERPITSLPLYYSFGLSVVNSHLLSGATIVCSNASMVTREFWNVFNQHQCTSFAGVPYNYQFLMKLGFRDFDLPTLRSMTQAGGRLSEEFVRYFHEVSINKKVRFFVMYGQTEATARISYVPPERLGEKIGSIGIPIPGGSMSVCVEGKESDGVSSEGELVYKGENVMMGYATERSQLANGDELNGVLYTGDLARKDRDGFFFITGRMKRFLKVLGLRINLDEVEKAVENRFAVPAACFGEDDKLMLFAETRDRNQLAEMSNFLTDTYGLHYSVYDVRSTDKIVVTPSGKRNYQAMKEQFAHD
jgi:long-chain acyl-CoA synthetase